MSTYEYFAPGEAAADPRLSVYVDGVPVKFEVVSDFVDTQRWSWMPYWLRWIPGYWKSVKCNALRLETTPPPGAIIDISMSGLQDGGHNE